MGMGKSPLVEQIDGDLWCGVERDFGKRMRLKRLKASGENLIIF
jgi:hypothetical protein